MGVPRAFGDDALAYFTERLDPGPTRTALAATVRRAKRNKAFSARRWIGVAIDGTGAGHGRAEGCALCHPLRDAQDQVIGSLHHFALMSVVGAKLTLPFDIEPYGPGDSEYVAGQRLLERAVAHVGRRFADYVVVDGEFATAPFLHVAGALGLRVVARLKANLPTLFAAAQARFAGVPPTLTIEDRGERIELWDADDFDPWETLRWTTVRVLRYRQHKPQGLVVEDHRHADVRVGPRVGRAPEQLRPSCDERFSAARGAVPDGQGVPGGLHAARDRLAHLAQPDDGYPHSFPPCGRWKVFLLT